MIHLALLSMVLFFSNCSMSQKHLLWQEIDAPGGILRIEYDEPPAFGSHTLYFRYQAKDSDDWQQLDTLELNNDGANLGEHNLEILERSAIGMKVLLHGQQQADVPFWLTVTNGKATLQVP